MDQNEIGQKVFRCQKCGHILNPNHKYCSTCGAPNVMFQNSRPNQMDHDDLPVINVDDIFGNLEPENNNILPKTTEKDDDLPVIDMEGLFDDVPFADTSNYQQQPEIKTPVNNQYYTTGSQPLEENELVVDKQPVQPEQQMGQRTASEQVQQGYQRPGSQPGRQMGQPMGERPEHQNDAAIDQRRNMPIDEPETDDLDGEEEMPEKKSKKKVVLIVMAILAVLAIGITCFFMFRNKSTKADLMDICEVNFTGVNGKGKVELSFNEKCDLYSNFFIKDRYDACEELKKVTFKATPDSGLSNGDTVTITADTSKADLEKYDIKVINDTKQVVISGLEEASDYDLFEGVTVRYEGYEGNGKATIDTTACDSFAKENVTYKLEQESDNLKNGDKVVVVAEVSDEKLDEHQYKVDSKTKEFTVEGLAETQEYDIFDKLSISYSGASPNLSLSVDTSSCDDFVKSYVTFTLSKTDHVSSGDSITITASVDEEKAKENGYKISTTTKTVTVNNVSSYLSSISREQARELDNELQSTMEDQVDEQGESYIFDRDIESLFNDGETYSFESATNETALRYFLYNPEKSNVNSYIIIEKYTITVVNEATGETRDTVLYAESTISNIIVDADNNSLSYDEPSKVVTDTDLNYFINEVNGLGYSITSVN